MTNHPFKRYGIEFLSCSSLNLWRAQPGLWAVRYLAKVKDDGTAAMWRGTAVENGLSALLRGAELEQATKLAEQNFDLNRNGQIEDEITQERELIAPMLKQCADWTPPADLSATQMRVQYVFPDVPIPIIGYLDFAFESGHDVDLKTTKACPSTPRPDHVRQVSLYRAARGRTGGVLYVTGKRWAYYDINDDMMERALGDIQSDALTLQNFLSRCDSKQDALRSLPIDWDSFYAPKVKVPLHELLLAG